jgi:DNA-binding Xre family transcriptional regulator/ribosomal protein L40E
MVSPKSDAWKSDGRQAYVQGVSAEMGTMAKRGRKPDLKRRKEARDLRRQGLTIGQIAAQLGITPQGAHHLLGKLVGPRPIMCRKCGALVFEGKRGVDNIKNPPVCLRCLANMPDAAFGDRLRSVRLARGMSQRQLAEATGLTIGRVLALEKMTTGTIRWSTLVKLIRCLGPELVRLDGRG